MGMHYYMAPLEAITTYTYRQAHAKVYGPLDKYFIPFLETHEKRDFKTRELQEILPEHNEGIYVVPQILTNKADGFIRLGKALKDYGYQEINLNLGCPSKTVVTKGKGSGFLAFPEELDCFLDNIFEALGSELKLSVTVLRIKGLASGLKPSSTRISKTSGNFQPLSSGRIDHSSKSTDRWVQELPQNGNV